MKNIIIGILVIVIIILAVLGLSNKKEAAVLETPASETETTETENSDLPQMISVNVYFNNITNDPELIECNVVYPVPRQIPYTQGVGMAALNELIAGPTAADTANGYRSSVQPSGQVNSLSISNGVAYVDVNAAFFSGGSCGAASSITSLKETLMQFPSVQEVEVTVDGMDFSDYAQNLV